RINQRGALICAADLKAQRPDRGHIRIGRTLVGRCYRRKELLLSTSLKPTSADDLAYEPVPGEENLPPPTVACGIPLLCPEPKGRKIGVLYVTSRSNITGLSGLLEDRNRASDLLKEVKAWYTPCVPAALGIKRTLLEP